MKKLKKNQIEKLKKYWYKLLEAENDFCEKVFYLECEMQKELGIEDLEFFNCDGYCGIGNYSRTIKLITSEELE